MCFIAANGTGKAAVAHGRPTATAGPEPGRRWSLVEDLNWPVPGSGPQKKPKRVVEVWVPGPPGSWEGEVPALQ